MAAVFCASLRRRAMVWRSRVIFTRSSRAASSAGDGARTWIAAAGCATGVGAAAARSIAASMSPLVTRPSLPEPGTVAGSMPVSAAILRTDGARHVAVPRLGRHRPWRHGAAAALGAADRASSMLLIGPAGRRRSGLAAARRAFRDLAEQRADRDGLAVLGGDLAEHAGGRRRHLDRHLVGFELDQRLVDRDRIARLLEPLADGRLGHGFAERGHADFGHCMCSLPLALVSSSAKAGDPVAVTGWMPACAGMTAGIATPTPLRGTP